MEPEPQAFRAQNSPPSHRPKIRTKLSSWHDRGRSYLDRLKIKASAPAARRQAKFYEKVATSSTQSSGSWAPIKPSQQNTTAPKTLHEDFAKFIKLLDPTYLTQSQPGMKRSSTQEYDDARKRTKRKDGHVVDDSPTSSPRSDRGVELRFSEWTKRLLPLQRVVPASNEPLSSAELSNLGSQFDNLAGHANVPPPSPVEGVLLQDPGREFTPAEAEAAADKAETSTLKSFSEGQGSSSEQRQAAPDATSQASDPNADPPGIVNVPMRQSTQSSVGVSSTTDTAERRLSGDSLSTIGAFAGEVFSRPQSTVSTTPSSYDTPSRVVSQTARQILAKKAMSSSCSLNNPLDPILLWDTQSADPVDFPLGDDWILTTETTMAAARGRVVAKGHEPNDATSCIVAEPLDISDKDREMSRDMARLKLCNGEAAEAPESENCDIDLDSGLSVHQITSIPASDANGRPIHLVFRRASLQPQPINESPISSASTASQMNNLLLTSQSTSLLQPGEHMPDRTIEKRPSLSTISEGYSDIGNSPRVVSPTLPSNGLARIVSQESMTPSCDSKSVVERRSDRALTPQEQQCTPATSVADPIEADVNSSESESEDDDSVATEETDESLVEAFVATALDPRLLRTTMALKDGIRLLVLSRVAAWIQTAAQDYGEGSQQAPGPDQAPTNSSSQWNNTSSLHQTNLKRALDTGNGDGMEGGGDDDQDKRPRGHGETSRRPLKEQTWRFACPWAKRYPGDTKSSCRTGFKDVHRTKEHLYKHHHQPIHCKRCLKVFKSIDESDLHAREKVPCELREDHPGFLGIDENTKSRLRCRKGIQSLKEHERWEKMWDILFPDTQCPPPYHDITCIENDMSRQDREKYREFLRRELPDRIIGDINARIRRSPLGDAAHELNVSRELSQLVLQAVWDAFDVVLPSLLPHERPRPNPLGAGVSLADSGGTASAPAQSFSEPPYSQNGTQIPGDMSEFAELMDLFTGESGSPSQVFDYDGAAFTQGEWQQNPK